MKVVFVDATTDVLVRRRPGANISPVVLRWARAKQPGRAAFGVEADVDDWEVVQVPAQPGQHEPQEVVLYPQYAVECTSGRLPGDDSAALRIAYRPAHGVAHGAPLALYPAWHGMVVQAALAQSLPRRLNRGNNVTAAGRQ